MRRFYIGIPKADGSLELHPMKDWVRSNAATVPSGLTADSTSHQLRDGLRRAGWQVRQSAEQVVLIPPDGPRLNGSHLPPPRAVNVTADELGRWRRSILRLLDSLDNHPSDKHGVGSRIRSLAAAGRLPRLVAACMHVVVEVRNVSEYEQATLSPAQCTAVRACWAAVREWAEALGTSIPHEG